MKYSVFDAHCDTLLHNGGAEKRQKPCNGRGNVGVRKIYSGVLLIAIGNIIPVQKSVQRAYRYVLKII